MIFDLYWFILGYTLIFPSLNTVLAQCFYILGLFWNMVDMPVSLPADKLFLIQQLALYCCRCSLMKSITFYYS